METAPLKSFATWARTALIREVTARITVVLAPASPERVEQPRRVEALERAVDAAGGDAKGRAAVADRVAYTWFNRIIALRFMDANGYTGIGVVSPQAGVASGQPEILAEAKRGQFDTEVVDRKSRDYITGLLDGTRRSADPQGESYALLLVTYCRHWNRSMPFMFQREGDFTELLIPADLLADESVLSRAVKVLTEEVCKDVEVIGWLYQFYISERKDEVFAGFKKNKKAGAAEIPAATQLFTPHWIVRYLVENSLGRLWMLNRPSSRLVDQMDYYIAAVDEESNFLKINSPEELKVIDPACGSGHMLTYAFDLLYAIYEEEGFATSDIPGLILANNLYGTEIDPRAGALAAFSLTMKARARQRTFFSKTIEPAVVVLESVSFTDHELELLGGDKENRYEGSNFWNMFEHARIRGSLIQGDANLAATFKDHLEALVGDEDLFAQDLLERARRVVTQADVLSSKYAIVVANPPYMGNASMDSELSEFAKRTYPDTKSDLFAMFIERANLFAWPAGLVAMVTMQSWMFLKTFMKLRRSLLTHRTMVSMAHLGTGAFDSIAGEVVSTTAFVVANHPDPQSLATFIRVTEPPGESAKAAALSEAIATRSGVDLASAADLMAVPGYPVAYWLSPSMRDIFSVGDRLDSQADVKHGLSTGRNAAVVRLWYEVSACDFAPSVGSVTEALRSGNKWFPYNKGGQFRRWYGNVQHILRYDSYGSYSAGGSGGR